MIMKILKYLFFLLSFVLLNMLNSCDTDMLEESNNYEPRKGLRKGECRCPATGEAYSWYCGSGQGEVCLESRPCPPLPPDCGMISSSNGD